MFQEDMQYKEVGKFSGGDGIMSGDEQRLFGEPINNNKDGVEARRGGKFLDEIHQNRIPRAFRDRELLEISVWFMVL
jgi:hypothetical protein